MKENQIFIKNVYYMLSYAFQVLRQKNYEEIEGEEFQNINDLFAAILSKGISQQIKRGLYREYTQKEEELSTLRGKLQMQQTIKLRMQKKQRLACQYDELSENNIYNQILKMTSVILIRQEDVKEIRKNQLRKNLLFFGDVTSILPEEILWEKLRFQSNNQTYQMMINICYFILDGILLSDQSGKYKVSSFIDEQKMCRLYEKFILEYYRYHYPIFQANSTQIYWNVDNDVIDFLPRMQTDVTLKYQDKTLIIDAKYYANMMQEHYEVRTIHSANLYQIFTYVKNMDKDGSGKVSGMLLYAKTQEKIASDHEFSMSGNRIFVKTLDLNLPFLLIQEQLERIADILKLS